MRAEREDLVRLTLNVEEAEELMELLDGYESEIATGVYNALVDAFNQEDED